MKKIGSLCLILLAVLMINSCEKDEITPTDTTVAPELPPMQTFLMPTPFEKYDEVDTTGFVSEGEIESRSNPSTYHNWFYSGVNLVVWNIAVGVNLALPVASFAESFNHNPEPLGNGVYAWRYSVDIAGKNYDATLTGQFISDNEIEWIMTISQEGGFQDVVWYEGIVTRDGRNATWTAYHQPLNPEPYLRINYENVGATSDFKIRYTNIIPNHPDNGHYIEYRTDDNGEFNRAYDVYRGSEEFLEIQWDEPTFEGRVRNPAHFNDNNWHCWNAEKKDIDC